MAVLAAAQLLDELMGRHRNTNPNEKIKKPNWEDPEVSDSYVKNTFPKYIAKLLIILILKLSTEMTCT